MGLFRPFNEMTNKVYDKAYDKAFDRFKNSGNTKHLMQAEKFYSGALFNRHKKADPSLQMKDRAHMFDDTLYLRKRKKMNESTVSLLGLTDEEVQELNEGNCNSSTCKCKGGTCPVDVTDGISTSAFAAKKLASAGSNNQTDLSAVKPNAEYNRQNDALFIGDGDSPETSKTNIPAILAAKTAGGSPHGWTTSNGINGKSADVFKIKRFGKRDDDDGPNG